MMVREFARQAISDHVLWDNIRRYREKFTHINGVDYSQDIRPAICLIPLAQIIEDCTYVRAQENPFIQMAGEPYSSYFEYLDRNIYQVIDRRDAAEAALVAAWMREAAKISKNKKWQLEADFYEESYRFSHEVLMRKPEQALMDSLGAIFTANLADINQNAALGARTFVMLCSA